MEMEIVVDWNNKKRDEEANKRERHKTLSGRLKLSHKTQILHFCIDMNWVQVRKIEIFGSVSSLSATTNDNVDEKLFFLLILKHRKSVDDWLMMFDAEEKAIDELSWALCN